MDFSRNTKTVVWLIVLWLLVCNIQYVLSQDSTVLSLYVQKGNSNTPFNFDLNMYQRFYDCLCSRSNTSRCIVSSNQGTVINVKMCPVNGNENQIPFTCQQSTTRSTDVVCERQLTPENPPILCTEKTLEVQDNVCPQVQIHWNSSQNVAVHNYSSIVGRVCDNNCKTIALHLFSSSPTISIPVIGTTTKANMLRRTTSVVNNSARPVTISSKTTSAAATTLTTEAAKDSGDDGKEGENESDTIIIIGATIGVIVIVAFIIIIVLIFWRRKKKVPSSTTTNNSHIGEEDDIYPYGDSTLNRTEPNENQNIGTLPVNWEVNSNPTILSLISSSGYEKAKANVDSQYTLAGSQPHKKPDSTVDGADSNGYEKAQPESIYPYTANHPSIKNKPTPAAEAVSSSEYGEIRPDTAIQYSVVDLAAKKKLTPLPAGVYAKLHEPVRNISNIYNESPANENTGDC